MCWNWKLACGKLEVNGLLQIQPRGEGRGKERGNFGSCILRIWPVILKLWPRWYFYFERVFIRMVHSRSLCSTLLEEIISSTLFNVRVRACLCLGLIGSIGHLSCGRYSMRVLVKLWRQTVRMGDSTLNTKCCSFHFFPICFKASLKE